MKTEIKKDSSRRWNADQEESQIKTLSYYITNN